MPEPVKLSRERWEMLKRAKTAFTGHALGDIAAIVSVTAANRLGLLTVSEPIEIDGITFLPAEYVPADDGSHVEYRFRNGSSIAVG